MAELVHRTPQRCEEVRHVTHLPAEAPGSQSGECHAQGHLARGTMVQSQVLPKFQVSA